MCRGQQRALLKHQVVRCECHLCGHGCYPKPAPERCISRTLLHITLLRLGLWALTAPPCDRIKQEAVESTRRPILAQVRFVRYFSIIRKDEQAMTTVKICRRVPEDYVDPH